MTTLHYPTILVAGVALFGCASELADIRPERLRAKTPSEAEQTQGRSAMTAMLKTHGYDAWKRYNFVHAKAADEWFNSLYFTLGAPYTENPEHAVVAAYTQRFPDARIEFTGGKNAGHVWAVGGDRIRIKRPGEETKAQVTQDDAFFAAFVHNFPLWPNIPFQLATATHVTYLDSAKWEGKTFDRILIGWGGFEPSERTDQWILWVNQDTHILERVWFTIRLAGQSQVGGYNLREIKAIQGMKIATVCEGVLDLEDGPLHTYTYRDIEFSRRRVEDLMAVVPR